MAARATAVALLLLAAGPALADAPGALTLDGTAQKLEAGLAVTADGTVWITDGDVRSALGVHVKRLVPRPPAGRRPRPSRERSSWILCGPTRCATYQGRTLGTEQHPTFDLAKLARALGYRLRVREGVARLTSPAPAGGGAAPRARRTRIGGQVGDVALPLLAGGEDRLGTHRGRRLLIVTWSSWSPARDALEEWLAAWSQRKEASLDAWFVALDAEGALRARDYVPVGFEGEVLLDANADLLRVLPANDVGHWYLLDELGILRAEGERLGPVELAWIDLHLEEPLVADVPALAAPPAAADLQILRERAAARPDDVEARLALAGALQASDPDAARAEVAAVIERKPRSVALPFRLARMHVEAGDVPSAMAVLDEARRRMPGAWVLRKQYWALEEPARFYGGKIDLAWQNKKRKEENAWLDRKGRRR